jgi:hypothetical protein
LLHEMGFSSSVIRGFDNEKVFYRNIYIMKPKLFRDLAIFMQHAMEIVKSNDRVATLFAVDSKYKEGTEEVAKRIFGTTYYQLHPFVFERLPSFYLYTVKAKVCGDRSGPCKYNS